MADACTGGSGGSAGRRFVGSNVPRGQGRSRDDGAGTGAGAEVLLVPVPVPVLLRL